MATAEPYAVTVLKDERTRCADALTQKRDYLATTVKVTESEIRHLTDKLAELDAGLHRLDSGAANKAARK